MKKIFLYVFVLSGLICTNACGLKSEQQVQIKLELFYQGNQLSCENLASLPAQLKELRFYVHDISLANKKMTLSNSPFQTDNIAYVDFSATQRHCGVEAALSPNQLISLSAADSGLLSFKLGVPSSKNHQNPVKAKPALNRSDMHWQWLSGYKFLRLEYVTDNELNRFHLGSIGCSGRIPNAVNCKHDNYIGVTLENFDVLSSVIEVHIDELIKPSSGSLCMGNPDDQHCQQWFRALQNDVFKIGDR